MHRALAVLLLLTLGACSDDDSAATPDATTTSSAASSGRTTATTTPADPLGGFEPAPLQWEGCGDQLQCATLAVPLDWANPAGPTIDVGVSRIPASGDDPLGGIAVNPGGPGGSGNEFIAAGGVLDADLTERFDTISWDPRGLGGSAPLDCEGAEVDRFVRLDSEPDSPGEQTELDDGARLVGEHCEEVAGAELPYVGTDDVARDLEAIRRAYGAPMGYVGFSYGTLIGLRHLALFPGAMIGVVLDGVVDPEDTLTDLLRSQAAAFEATIDEVLRGCPAGSEGCPDGGGEAAYDALAAQLEEAPLPAGRAVLQVGDLATAAIYTTYSERTHAALLDGLGAAQSGDGSALLSLADSYHALSTFDLYQAVSCLDSVNPHGSEAWVEFAAEVATSAPRVGAAVANEMLPCAFWPVPPRPVTGPVVAEGAGPVVVLAPTGDPVTPVHQAEAVARTLADGRFVSVDAASHGGYFASECARQVVSTYFIDGEPPADGTAC